jgi:hypothetical protein
MRLVVVLASAALVTSCGGGDSSSSPGTATLTGTVRGKSFTPGDATAAVISFTVNGRPGKAAAIALTSATGLCSTLTAGKEPRSTQYLVLTPFNLQPDFSPTTPTAPGAYQVGALTLQNGAALFSATDAACQVTLANTVRASTGTITLTTVGSRYTGSYDLTFEFGDRITGTFDAPVCGNVDASQVGQQTLACQ